MIDHREVSRVTSPDGRTDAVIQTADGGPTTSIAYQLYLVPMGTKKMPSADFSVFVADHVEDLMIRWVEPRLLEISYREARIFKFTNFETVPYVIELRLNPTSNRSLSERDRQ